MSHFHFSRTLDLIINSDTTDEGTVFVPRKTSTLEEFRGFIQGQYPVIKPYHLDLLSDLYPPSRQFPRAGEYWHSTSEAYGELRYVCPGIHLSNLYSRYNVKGVYNYRSVTSLHSPLLFASIVLGKPPSLELTFSPATTLGGLVMSRAAWVCPTWQNWVLSGVTATTTRRRSLVQISMPIYPF